MKKHTLKYIRASDLFNGCMGLYDDLSTSSKITWGGAKHTLVALRDITGEVIVTGGHDKQNQQFDDNCKGLDRDTLVDLET